MQARTSAAFSIALLVTVSQSARASIFLQYLSTSSFTFNYTTSGSYDATGTLLPGNYSFNVNVNAAGVASQDTTAMDKENFAFDLGANNLSNSSVFRNTSTIIFAGNQTNNSVGDWTSFAQADLPASTGFNSPGPNGYTGSVSHFSRILVPTVGGSDLPHSEGLIQSRKEGQFNLAGPGPGLVAEGPSSVLRWNFTISQPTTFWFSGDILSTVQPSGIVDHIGSTELNPILPTTGSPGVFNFAAAPTGQWFDPPSASEFDFHTSNGSLFTKILDFPNLFVGPFTVSAGGNVLGQFIHGQSVDFTSFAGGGVSDFSVSGINDPQIDLADGFGFPLKLDFNTPNADFTMTAVPEPSALALAVVACAVICHFQFIKNKVFEFAI
jgi:hypothetical protein